MADVVVHPSQREATRRFLEQVVRSELGRSLRMQLARRYPGVGVEEVEDALQGAYADATEQWRGSSPRQLYRWLLVVADHALADDCRRRAREVPADGLRPRGHATESGAQRSPVAAEGERDPETAVLDGEAEAEIQAVAHAVVACLSDRQREITALHVRGRKRPQIARHLGMSERTVKRQLERIFSLGRGELISLAGGGCDLGRQRVARIAFGLAAAKDAREAQLHLLECSECASLFERLEEWRERVAALLPVPAAEPQLGAVQHIAHAAIDTADCVKDEAAHLSAAARQQLSAVADHAKQHAANAYYRAVDPTPLAGARPGAAAAAIASCLALTGSAATYCIKQGGIPVPPPFKANAKPESEKPVRPQPRSDAVAELPRAPIVTAPSTTTSAAAHPPASSEPQPQSPPPAPPPAPEEEFEPQAPVASAASVQASTAVEQPARAEPAPASSSGPSEFEP